LTDRRLLLLSVKIERAKRQANFFGILEIVEEMEAYLKSIGKRQLIVFVYTYLKFSDFGPKLRELDEDRPNGRVRKACIFNRHVSDEGILIGLWAGVKFTQLGYYHLRVVYSSDVS
jgi:hypothetical protein